MKIEGSIGVYAAAIDETLSKLGVCRGWEDAELQGDRLFDPLMLRVTFARTCRCHVQMPHATCTCHSMHMQMSHAHGGEGVGQTLRTESLTLIEA